MTALVPGRFTTAIRTDGGEPEVRLTDGGHWQVKAKLVEAGDALRYEDVEIVGGRQQWQRR